MTKSVLRTLTDPNITFTPHSKTVLKKAVSKEDLTQQEQEFANIYFKNL